MIRSLHCVVTLVALVTLPAAIEQSHKSHFHFYIQVMSKRCKKNRREPVGPPDLANVRLTVEPDRLEIVWSRKRRWAAGLGLIVFNSFWINGLYQVAESFFRHGWGIGEIFAIGVLSFVVLLLFYFILCCFFHRERLRIDSNGLDWRFTAIFPFWHRKVPWEQLVKFDYGYIAREWCWGCKVETIRREFYVFLDLPPYGDGTILRRFLQHFITKYRETNSIATPVAVFSKKREQVFAAEEVRKRNLIKNRWTFRDDGSGMLVFERWGWVSIKSSVVLLVVCLFWNGGISIFVAACVASWMSDQASPFFRWFLTIFLIPFVLIGQMFLFGSVTRMLQYFCRYKITIDETGVRYRRSWFGIGRTRFWTHANIIRVSILRNRKDLTMLSSAWNSLRNPEFSDSVEGVANDCSFAIHFSNGTDGKDKHTSDMIRDLYEQEARAIAAKIRVFQ